MRLHSRAYSYNCSRLQLTMGRGKRFIRWLKKLLFHKKRSNVTANKTTGFSDWEESEIPCIAPGSPAESCNVDIRTSFSDISIGTFLSHEPSLTGSVQPQVVIETDNTPFTNVCGELEGQVPDYSDYPPQFEVKWSMFGWDCNEDSSSNVWPPPPMTFGGKDLLERSASHHEDLNTIVDDNEWLFPIEECYSKASIKLPNLPKPPIIITSNFGNVAFEVNFAQEEHPRTMRKLVFNSTNRGKHGSQWVKRREFNRQASLKNKCDSMKRMRERALSVRQRKTSNFRPHIHATSLLQELTDTVSTTTPATTIGGTAIGRGGVAFEVFLPKEDLRSIASIPVRFSTCPPVDKKALAHGLEARMEKKTLSRKFYLLQRCQRIWNKEDRDTVVRQRKKITSIRPTIHGESLLAELPVSPDISSMSISRGGVAFAVATIGCLTTHPTTTRPSWLLKMATKETMVSNVIFTY